MRQTTVPLGYYDPHHPSLFYHSLVHFNVVFFAYTILAITLESIELLALVPFLFSQSSSSSSSSTYMIMQGPWIACIIMCRPMCSIPYLQPECATRSTASTVIQMHFYYYCWPYPCTHLPTYLSNQILCPQQQQQQLRRRRRWMWRGEGAHNWRWTAAAACPGNTHG